MEAKKHAVRSGLVDSFAEFDKRFPKEEYVFVWGMYGTPAARKRYNNNQKGTLA